MTEFNVGDRVKKVKGTKGAGEWETGVVVELRDWSQWTVGVQADGEDPAYGTSAWWMEPKELKHV